MENQNAANPPDRALPVCRWRTSSETVDVVEALERIEALLIRIDERLTQLTEPTPESKAVRR